MSVLSEEKVLRLNAPGFGISSTLPLGEAKPLAMYDVIVVNPISVLHLFDNKSDHLKQIEMLQSDGMTSFRAGDDSVIESIVAELDIRAQELHQFLKKGGLLVYFLVPPFVVQGPNQSMDNYSWLGDWAPDKPTGSSVRNMSATIRGKAVETSADAEKSVWLPYLKQAGLEWSTIIRLENLTDAYVPLATAGPNKCIAGFKSSGPKSGQVVFLPAPFNANFDAALKECLNRWYAVHCDDAPVSSGLQDLSKGLSSLLSDEPALTPPALPGNNPASVPPVPPLPGIAGAGAPAVPPVPPVLPSVPETTSSGGDAQWTTVSPAPIPAASPTPATAPVAPAPVAAVPEPVAAPTPVSAPAEMPAPAPVGNFEDKSPALPQVEPAGSNGSSPPNMVPASGPPSSNVSSDAGGLIRKMSQELTKPAVPEWCSKFSFEELEGLRNQFFEINEEIRLAQVKAQELQSRIQLMDDLKNSLLSAQGEHLVVACSRVFERLGWQVKLANDQSDELWLVEEDKTQAIVRLIYSTGQPNRSELASLAESVITYWGAHEVEPKGILVASTWADKPPQERPDEDFADSMNEFAKRKNLCLLTTAQLLSVYRDLDINEPNPKTIRDNLLTTSGRVTDFVFNKQGVAAGV